MRLAHISLVLLFLLLTEMLPAQQAVDQSARYFRVICLVHLTGSGKTADSVRPDVVPEVLDPANGIVAWSMMPTDNKNMAILHIVATNRKALDAILNDKRSDVKVFEIGKHGKASIEQEMRKHKKDFDLERFAVVAR